MTTESPKKTLIFCLTWFVLVSRVCAVSAAEQPTELKAIPLIEVKNVTSLNSEWKKLVCNLSPQPCDTQTLKLYRAKIREANQYYAIAPSGPAIAKLAWKETNHWQTLQYWDFSQYIHTSPPINDLGGTPSPLTIYPALYPIAPNQWAVAIVSTYREFYSGGGAGFDTADFVVLNDSTDKQAEFKQVFSSIPFSCSKHIRACFSENEYKTSKHCQEENFGKLLLQFKSSESHSASYNWFFTWEETSWPAHQPAKQKKVVKTQFLINPYTDADKQIPEIGKIPFCGGPQ